jgi:hypothetical protein
MFAIAMPEAGGFNVDIVSWDEITGRLANDRESCVKDITSSYDCVVGFSDISLDVEQVLFICAHFLVAYSAFLIFTA